MLEAAFAATAAVAAFAATAAVAAFAEAVAAFAAAAAAFAAAAAAFAAAAAASAAAAAAFAALACFRNRCLWQDYLPARRSMRRQKKWSYKGIMAEATQGGRQATLASYLLLMCKAKICFPRPSAEIPLS